MRDHTWLQNRLEELLKKYFSDVPITNPIEIRWGREAKFRFGSIRLEGGKSLKVLKGLRGLFRHVQAQESQTGAIPKKSIITITKMFVSQTIPIDVVLYTISHELTHYAHGFSSVNKRLFRHPHHGGIVNAEIERRGAKHLVKAYKNWLKEYRGEILAGRKRI